MSPKERAEGDGVMPLEPEPPAAARTATLALYEGGRLPFEDVPLQRPQYLSGFRKGKAEVLQPLGVLLQYGKLYYLFSTLLVFGHELQPEL